MTSKCPCCGHVTAASAMPTIWVEEDVLALCNRAFEIADAASSAEVELRHLAEALEAMRGGGELVARYGITITTVIDAARRVPLAGLAGTGERPRTSVGVKTLLARAERQAVARGLQSISLALVVATLMTDMRDIDAASFVPRSLAAKRGPVGNAAGGYAVAERLVFSTGDGGTERSRRSPMPQFVSGRDQASFIAAIGRADAPDHASTAVAPRGPDIDVDRLVGRFEAQERQIALLQKQIATLSSELGVGVRSHRRFFRKRRSSTALSRYLRRRTMSTSSASARGERSARSRSRAAALPSPTLLADTDAPEPDFESDADDTLPLGSRPKRFYLALEDDVVKAPSIGPRTAAKLTAVGVSVVRDLLLSEPEELAAALQTRYITPQRIVSWQAQARLVCTVPWLRGTHAQMLVGAGYDTVKKLEGANREALCAAVLQFAGTRDGQSVLRSSPPPESERIMRWADFAAMAEYDRAATHAYTH